jgi:hypothetical protein
VIFCSYVSLPEGIDYNQFHNWKHHQLSLLNWLNWFWPLIRLLSDGAGGSPAKGAPSPSRLPGLVNVNKKRTGKIHHAINGEIHYFDWAIFNSYVTNYESLNVIIVQLYPHYIPMNIPMDLLVGCFVSIGGPRPSEVQVFCRLRPPSTGPPAEIEMWTLF